MDFDLWKKNKGIGLVYMFDNIGKLYKEIGTNRIYMLAQVGYHKFNMINVDTGNRMHTDPSSFAHEVLDGFELLAGWKLELHQEVEEVVYNNPCPDCGTQLIGGDNMSGVKCPKPDCGYWFCF